MAGERKCSACRRYVCADGSDLCAPCLATQITGRGTAPANCADCVREYFAGMEQEPPARRYRDPDCPRATPWCALYQGIVERIKWAGETGLARYLNQMRRTMQRRQKEAGR